MTFHTIPFKFYFTALWVALFLLPVQAQTKGSQDLAQLREKSLKTAMSPTDSIRILLDVYNLSDKPNRDRIRGKILNMVQRSSNEEVIGMVIQDLSMSTDEGKDLDRLLKISEGLPEGERRDNYQTVIEMEKAQAEAGNVTDSQIQTHILENTLQMPGSITDPYKEIQNIYRAMTYLGSASQGPLYLEYVKRLEELVSALPEKDHAIRNLFYTTAALFYTRKRDYATAIDYDRRRIKELDAIAEHYKNAGDDTHSLDYFYYVSYRQMLRNFMGLSPEEIEEVYAKCCELASRDEQVAQEFNKVGLSNSYYYIGTHQFAKAIPELNKALNSQEISNFRRQELLGLLAWAYRETGDSKNELAALREYTTMMLADMEVRRENTYKEIELRANIDKLIADQALAQEQQKQSNRVMRKTAITLVYVLAVILIFLCGAYLRLRGKVKELEMSNSKLHRNIEHIFDDGVPRGTRDLRHQKNRLKG